MARIVAGLFEDQVAAESAIRLLRERGVERLDVTTFVVNPPGMHHGLPLGGDEPSDPGARQGESGALKGAAVGGAVGIAAGLLATPLVGPVAIAAGIGAGALVGSVAGATHAMGERSDELAVAQMPTARPGGVMVAVNTGQNEDARIVDALEVSGATLVEEAEGEWVGGEWLDFDPVQPPQHVVAMRGNPVYPT